jgi:hypothetical protein
MKGSLANDTRRDVINVAEEFLMQTEREVRHEKNNNTFVADSVQCGSG